MGQDRALHGGIAGLGAVVMRLLIVAIVLLAGYTHIPRTAYSDQVPCRDETRKIAALKDRIASLERTLEAERFDKIDLNYKFIVATLALNKSEAVVASLKVENARLKAGPVPIAASAVPVPHISAKIIPSSSKSPQKSRSRTVSKRSKITPIVHNVPARGHAWQVVKPFWPQ
jgi:hypothetical protein